MNREPVVIDEAGFMPNDVLERFAAEQREVQRLSPIAVELDENGHKVDPFAGPPPEMIAQAKRIKKRRRKLGRNGFAVGAMATPKKRAAVRTRNSR